MLFEELTRAKKEKDQTEKRNLQSERDFGSPTSVILRPCHLPRFATAASVCLPRVIVVHSRLRSPRIQGRNILQIEASYNSMVNCAMEKLHWKKERKTMKRGKSSIM